MNHEGTYAALLACGLLVMMACVVAWAWTRKWWYGALALVSGLGVAVGYGFAAAHMKSAKSTPKLSVTNYRRRTPPPCPQTPGDWHRRIGTCLEQHDNGGRPSTTCFTSLTGPGECTIWNGHVYPKDSDTPFIPNTVAAKYTYEKVWYKAAMPTQRWDSRGYDLDDTGDMIEPVFSDGSTFLLLLDSTTHRYAFCGGGHGLVEFTLPDTEPITEFYTPIGNNDVPYPWARSATHVFWFAEMAMAPRQSFESPDQDPRMWYDVRHTETPIPHTVVMGRECGSGFYD
jgi:hypothetical protein